MTAKGYRRSGWVSIRRTRCWKNRCNSGLLGACCAEHEVMLRPAFRDTSTGVVYPSCFTDGRPAPMHVIDGLPDSAVLARSPDGRVAALKQSVEAGFSGGGCFYTREEAAAVRQRRRSVTLFAAAWQVGQRFLFCPTYPENALEECPEAAAKKL